MERKIALLSNVNMNPVIRLLQGDIDIYQAEGYGNELGILMNPASSYHAFRPEITFLVPDLMELLEHDLTVDSAEERIGNWFAVLENALDDRCIYYVSDAYLWGTEAEVSETLCAQTRLEAIWLANLEELRERHANVRRLLFHHMISGLGEENAFSLKMWYMGKILLSGEAQKRLAALILECVNLEERTPKKVLLLDLDNTLWGGLAGENDHTPIVLSDEHGGLAYKNLQRVILQMQRQGVLLGIVSKNNEEDAEKILQNHPHMVLGPECFAVKRINWKPKSTNLSEIAEELNLGLDSFVFWDDNPEERMLIRQMLPEVTVPEFPAKAEDLAKSMVQIYHDYFERAVLTTEDLAKTGQYKANAKRAEMARVAGSFEEYLKKLGIVVTRVPAEKHTQRLEAMLNKTNQFNLTTQRHTFAEVQDMVEDPSRTLFLYQVEDCFGDNGVVAAVIVDTAAEIPVVEEFVMSCRVMGKNIEQGILQDVEQTFRRMGFRKLRAKYIPTAKNKPVEQLYPSLGYRQIGADLSGTTDTGQKEAAQGAPGQKRSEWGTAGEKLHEQEENEQKIDRAAYYEIDLTEEIGRNFVGEIRAEQTEG